MNIWQSVKVAELGRIVTGKTPKTAITENYGGDILFLTPSDDMSVKYVSNTAKTLTERGVSEVKNALLPPDTVCVSCIGSDLGKVVITSKNTVTNQQINSIIVDKKRFDVSFVYYAMLILGKELNFISKTSTAVPIVNKSSFSAYKILCPSLEQQKKIVTILSALDSKIECNKQINDNLEQQIQALFDTLFSDKIAMVDQLCHKPLGEMVETIDNRGKTPPLEVVATDYPIIDVRALSGLSRIIDYANCTKYVSDTTYASWFRSGHPKPLDILLSTVGSLAEIKLFLGTKGCIAQNVVGFRAKNISPYYLYQYLTTIKGDLVAYNIGSVQPSIKVTHIIKHPIYIPTEVEISQFDSLATSATGLIYKNNIESEYLASLRDTLLPKLMSGEIDVSDVQL